MKTKHVLLNQARTMLRLLESPKTIEEEGSVCFTIGSIEFEFTEEDLEQQHTDWPEKEELTTSERRARRSSERSKQHKELSRLAESLKLEEGETL